MMISGICCPKCDDGQIVFEPHKVLEDGSVVHGKHCTLCDYRKEFVVKPILRGKYKRVYCVVKHKEGGEPWEFEESDECYDSSKEVPKGKGYRCNWVETGKPILWHDHDHYGEHPVTRKHRKKKE